MAKNKAKVKKEDEVSIIPNGMKCYQKVGGGTHRFPNRIIKTGQKFWIYPESLPKAFADLFKEVAPDYGAVIVSTDTPVVNFTKNEVANVADKYEIIIATDADGNVIKKGKDPLFNVIGEDGKPINDKPLRQGKADEYLAALNI